MGMFDIAIIVFVVVSVIIGVLFLLNRWASRRMVEHSDIIERTKQTTSIYVIDKKRGKVSEGNFPKIVHEQLPKWNKMMKMYMVKAKVGPQIMTLMCDKQVFNAIPLKKTIKVDLAGIYIASVKGMKSQQEMEALRGTSLPWYKRLIRR